MKTSKLKFIVPLFITLILTGCMPDSLTKFKKDPPKKVETTTDEPSGTIIDPETGKPIVPATLIDPTIFSFKNESTSEEVTSVTATVGKSISLKPILDGSVADPTKVSLIFAGCSVTPNLPSGLVIDTTKTLNGCSIGGTPLAVSTSSTSIGSPITYTVTLRYNGSNGFIKTISTPLSIGVYAVPSTFTYSQNDKLLIKISSNNPQFSISNMTTSTDVDATYVRSGFLTTDNNIITVIKYVDSVNSVIGVVKALPLTLNNLSLLALPADEYPGILTPRFISSASGKVAKVLRTVTATNTIYVEMISGSYFDPGEALDNAKVFVAPTGTTVSTVDTSFDFRKLGAGERIPLDNNIQYYVEGFGFTEFTHAYEVDKTFGTELPSLVIHNVQNAATLTPQNGVEFVVSPALPPGISLDASTGQITGSFSDALESTAFTISAKNHVATTQYVLRLSAIKAPKDLSYTTQQLIAVKNTAKFIEGEILIQPVTPPLTKSNTARILRKYDNGGASTDENRYKLAIDTFNGAFIAGASLDSGNFFYSEKSYIPSTAIAPIATTAATTPIIVNYNVAISVASVTGFAIGGYVSTPQGASGRIVAIEGLTLFIQALTPGVPATFTPFQERNGGAANDIDNEAVYVGAQTTITQIEANTLQLVLASISGTPDFTTGNDITSSGKLAAYIFSSDQPDAVTPIDPTTVSVSDITKRPDSLPFLKNAQTIYDNETESGANSATLSNVLTENSIIIERGTYVEIMANTSQGNGLNYSASPALPTGLSINPKTGVISGTPSVRGTMKKYTLTATNLIGKSEYVFSLEVRDYFKLTDNSGATTFITHKYGASKNSRGCRINAADILEGTGDLDVRCFLDAEEEELHNTRIKLITSTGAGVCEFVQVSPFSFYRFSPIATDPSSATNQRHTTSGCATIGDLTAPEQLKWHSAAPTSSSGLCTGNYTNAGGPNCDEGSFTVTNHNGVMVGAACVITAEPAVTVQCGGENAACIQGPVTDFLSVTELSNGYRTLIYPTSNGTAVTNTFSSPSQKLDFTNLRVANSSAANQCLLSNDEADDWDDYANTTPATTSPFGDSNPFYTFNCLDGAKDIKARIRLVVRDWNKSFKINSSIDFDLPGALPLGASLMNNTDTVFNKSNNDYKDWDDSYNGAAAAFSACGTATTEHKYPAGAL